MTLADAQRLTRERSRALLRRRTLRWALVAVAVVVAGGWIYWAVGPGGDLPPPTSDVSSAPISSDDWPMLQREPSHAASVTGPADPLQGRIVWRFQTAAPFESSPAVVDGTVYASTGDRRIVALDAQSGEIRWQTEVSGPVASSPAVAGDMLYAGLKDGRFIALSTADGSLRWEFQSGGIVYASPMVRNGLVYIGSSDSRLYALDAVTGELNWSFRSNGRFLTGAGAMDEVVGVVSQDRRVYILDASTGRHRLQYALSAAANTSPVFDRDLMYVANNAGVVVGIDWKQLELPFERTARWLRLQLFVWGLVGTLPPPKGWVWTNAHRRESFDATPALGHGMLFAASESGRVFAHDRATGKTVWTYDADARITGSPSVVGQTVYVGDRDGIVYGIDALTGEEQWRFDVGGEVVSTPVVSGDTLYLTSADGSLYAVR